MNQKSGMTFIDWIPPYVVGPEFAALASCLGLIAILCLLGIGIRRLVGRQPSGDLGWWSERTGVGQLLLNVLILTHAMDIVLWALTPGVYRGPGRDAILLIELAKCAWIFAWSCGVALCGLAVSMVLRLLEQRSGT